MDNNQPAKTSDGLPVGNHPQDAFVMGSDLFHLSACAPKTTTSAMNVAQTRAVIIDVAKFNKGKLCGTLSP